MNEKQSARNHGKATASVLSVLVIAMFASGCGGGSASPPDGSAQSAYAPTARTETRQPNQAILLANSVTRTKSIASSFTLNSTDRFKGFNREVWNDHQSWTECNCGDKKPVAPKLVTWNPSN